MAKKKKTKYTKHVLLDTYRPGDKWKVLLSDFISSIGEAMIVYMVMGFIFDRSFSNNGIVHLKIYDYIGYIIGYFLIFRTSRRLYDEKDRKARFKMVLLMAAISMGLVMILTFAFSIFKIPVTAGYNVNWVVIAVIMTVSFGLSMLIRKTIK